MDGVLVDSYRAHFESWRVAMREQRRDMTEEQFAATFGRTSREVIAQTWPGQFSEAEIRALDDRKEAVFREILSLRFPVMPGALELLESLHESGIQIAIGSSGPPENVRLVLQRLGKQDLFGAVVTGEDVARGKPDPQVFLLAAERLGISPRRCAVVEDAQPGIEAARRAGMVAIGLVSTGRTKEQLAAADLVVSSLRELSCAR
jgi:beta-phosphoglucomutase